MENRLELLKGRVKRCVCKYCGQPLEIRKINRSSAEAGQTELVCLGCNRIEFGVEQEIYESAKYFVEQMEFNYYPDLDDTEKTKRMNIAKVCEIMAWQDKMLGFLEQDGFTVPLRRTVYMGECLLLTDEELEKIEAVKADAPTE